jgi:hypothetical protein
MHVQAHRRQLREGELESTTSIIPFPNPQRTSIPALILSIDDLSNRSRHTSLQLSDIFLSGVPITSTD